MKNIHLYKETNFLYRYSELLLFFLSSASLIGATQAFKDLGLKTSNKTLEFAFGVSGIVLGFSSLYFSYESFRCKRYHKRIIMETRNEEKFPIEHAGIIKIEDVRGLENLLDFTSEEKKYEWGTFINAYSQEGKCIINYILPPQKAQEQGLTKNNFWIFSKASLWMNIKKAEAMGFNGAQHYHPIKKSQFPANYSISYFDQRSPPNWINLLTFNAPKGPEIIAFNKRYVYIPKDESKKELIRATKKDIIHYLQNY